MSSHRRTQSGDAPEAESPSPAENTPPAFPAVTIPPGPVDTTLGAASPVAEPASDEQLRLPRGALVIMRRSGGFRFRTSVTVVFRDRRLAVAGGTHTRPKAVRRIDEHEMAALVGMLGDVEAAQLPPSVGRQNPDFYAYELAMRPKRQVRNLEVFEGSIPDAVEPLVRWLNAVGAAPTEQPAPPGDE